MRSIRPSPLLAALVCAAILVAETTAARAERPSPVSGLEDVLRQTSAIVSGRVAEVRYRYDEIEGPRTVSTLVDLDVHEGSLGSATRASIELRSFGGFLPDGREVTATHVPRLAEGERYLLFLRNTDWSLSPVAFEFVFHIIVRRDENLLVDPYGRLVAGLSTRGPLPGPALFPRRDGGLDPSASEIPSTELGAAAIARAWGPTELLRALAAFSEATGVWPSGTFFESPALPALGPSWRRIVSSPEPEAPRDDPAARTALACFGPPDPSEDESREEIAMCTDGGAP